MSGVRAVGLSPLQGVRGGAAAEGEDPHALPQLRDGVLVRGAPLPGEVQR